MMYAKQIVQFHWPNGGRWSRINRCSLQLVCIQTRAEPAGAKSRQAPPFRPSVLLLFLANHFACALTQSCVLLKYHAPAQVTVPDFLRPEATKPIAVNRKHMQLVREQWVVVPARPTLRA